MTLLLASCTSDGKWTLGECVSVLPAVAAPRRVGGTDQSAVVIGPAPSTLQWVGTLGLAVAFYATLGTIRWLGALFQSVTRFLATRTPRWIWTQRLSVTSLLTIETFF